MDKMTDILEKLSFDRLYKANINNIWKAVKKYYMKDFTVLPYTTVRIKYDVVDLGQGKNIFKTNYSLEKDKRVIIKEPYIVFGINTDNLTLTWRKSEKEDREYFLGTLSRNIVEFGSNTLRTEYLKEYRPTILDCIYRMYPEYKNNPDEKMPYEKLKIFRESFLTSSEGQKLWEEAYSKYFSKVMNGSVKAEFHNMSWLDNNILPMFIWDIDTDLIYNCGTDYRDIKRLDRRTLNSRAMSHIECKYFLLNDTGKKSGGEADIGFPLWLNNKELIIG